MRFIDTHVHSYDEAFDKDRAESFLRAINAGVTKMVLPAIDSTTYKAQENCFSLFPDNSFMTIGLHPTSVASNWRDELYFVENKLEECKGKNYFIAIGEVGLDLYWSKEFIKEQIEVFSSQIDLALKYDLPLIIHQRNALTEMFDLLESKPRTLRGVFHAFGGSLETYKRIKKYGNFKVGIGGVVTFKNAGLPKTIEDIPLEEIVLETDSPWLTPVPHRGERNESSYIPIIAQKIAEIKKTDIEEVATITTAQAESLFGI